MTRFLVFVLLTAMTALGTEITTPSASSNQTPATFNKNVLPVLQKNCQVCHRPGGVAPMSFMTYESTRPWAKAIREAVVSKQMPPWFADPEIGDFRNAPKLTNSDIKTLAAWAETGAAEGNTKDKPADIQWTDGWQIKPDVVVSMQEPYRLAARGSGEVKQFMIENPFKEDTWVSSIEIRPGDPSVVHHVILQIPEENAVNQNALLVRRAALAPAAVHPETGARQAQAEAQLRQAEAQLQRVQVEASKAFFVAGQAAPGQRGGNGGGVYSDLIVRLREAETGEGNFTTMEAVYAPGSQPIDYRYSNSAKLIKGGKPMRLEVHYTPNGKPTTDITKVGFTLAKAPAERQFVMMAPEHLIDPRKPIPPGEANWETSGELTFKQDAELVWFMPHMHLRGKDMTFRLIYPDGREENVLSAKFNFNWQLGYEVEKPIKIPKDTKMIVTAHHDNSANNPFNTTPNQSVRWGEMTSQEMMLPWFGVIVPRDAEPAQIARYVPPDLDSLPQVRLKEDLKVLSDRVGPAGVRVVAPMPPAQPAPPVVTTPIRR
ncbi:MAG TPA: cytochrome c [Terriglobia bacterium]|nr:cytochrome c [Terriglobia bacterium]